MRQDSGVEFEIAFQDGDPQGHLFSSRVEAVAWLEDQPT
jgi:hypothetical protein